MSKVTLPEAEMPRSWYNVAADLPAPLDPPLHPATHQPVGPDDLRPIFPMALIEQEMSTQREIPIPAEVLELYALWRPTPLHRAVRLERHLATPARIYFKNESLSPAGSHKPNTAIPQAWYNRQEGVTRLATETGAGQWGSALSLAGSLVGLEVAVYMVRVSYDQKPYRRLLMEAWGGRVVPSPSPLTGIGRAMLAQDPDCPGSLGIAISEAIEEAVTHPGTKYALGSVLNHVLLHQTVIGLEARRQMAELEEYPDVVVGCVGGGSNFAGLAFPFARDLIHGRSVRLLAVEPASCPTLTRGPFVYDFGDTGKLTPLLRMNTLGHEFIPPEIHAGGLRYHGAAPLVSRLRQDGLIEARACHQTEVFEAALTFARTEGILPAPETAHAIRAAIDEAITAREEGKERVILFNLSGHGHFDLASYQKYLEGALADYEYPQQQIDESLARLKELTGGI